ncbi:MAG: hypothetical protein KA120_00955 [Candidatus Goldbacteria bacterium]|nr:hypothetical protein [Candidatus Goldiibacteriota bacterium]
MKNKKDDNTEKNNGMSEMDVDNFIKNIQTKEELANVPKTLLKKEEWGLLTILSLILAGIFPAYFVNILLISFFTELGHLWTTHLSEKGRKILIDFEKEFRVGYEKEKAGDFKGAISVYEGLIPKYKDNPQIANIAVNRIEWIEKNKIKKGN